MRYLVNFATPAFYDSQERFNRSAKNYGIDDVRAFTRLDIKRTTFYDEHRHVLDLPRGAGYCLWKPYIILEVLSAVQDGDFVLYVDSGAEIISSIDPLVTLCEDIGGILLFSVHGHSNSQWTKRDTFVIMDCDEPRFHNAEQINAACQGYIKNSRSLEFVAEYLRWCKDERALTDHPNVCGQGNLPGYRDHRYDQSILSLLACKHSIVPHRDPTQFGNHLKAPEYRAPGELRLYPYSSSPASNSRYPTIFDHHRERAQAKASCWQRAKSLSRGTVGTIRRRLNERRLFPRSQLSAIIARNRRVLGSVSQWVDETAYNTSLFGYGLPPRIKSLIDKPLSDNLTYTDVLVYLATFLKKPLSYLELGVSVGKNFFQVLNSVENARLTGFDLEEINPTIATHLAVESYQEWESGENSTRSPKSWRTDYLHRQSGNRVSYLCGDILDELNWGMLPGPFNLIFSDALHTGDALRHESAMLERYRLVAGDEFVWMWDDLDGDLRTAFFEITDHWRQMTSKEDAFRLLVPLRGWLGQHENRHWVGIFGRSTRIARALGKPWLRGPEDRKRETAGGTVASLVLRTP